MLVKFQSDSDPNRSCYPRAFTLTELIACVAILGILSALVVPRLLTHNATAKKNACYVNKCDIELQAKLWRRNSGSYPAANLSNVGADTAYFPGGLPTCPVDNTTYTIDTTTGLVTGHTH